MNKPCHSDYKKGTEAHIQLRLFWNPTCTITSLKRWHIPYRMDSWGHQWNKENIQWHSTRDNWIIPKKPTRQGIRFNISALVCNMCTRSTYQSWGPTLFPWSPRLRGIIQLWRIGNVLRKIWLTLESLQIGVRPSRLHYSLAHQAILCSCAISVNWSMTIFVCTWYVCLINVALYCIVIAASIL